MALTFTPVKGTEFEMGRLRGRIFDVALDTSYPTGGYSILGKDIGGLLEIIGVDFLGGNPGSGVLIYQWDNTNNKLMVFYPSGGGAASPAALADPAITAGAVAVTSTAANGSADLTPGRGKEVANTTNLSTLTIRLVFYARA